jgi:signal recognition particle subunit SRP68
MASDGKGNNTMGLSQFIFAQRYDILLRGDYAAYRSQLTRRLLSLRRKLGRTTPKGKKYTGASPITAKDVASNRE